MSNIVQIADANEFDTMTKTGVVLVDFSAVWCRPCQLQMPILESITSHFEGKVKVIKVDIEQAQNVAVRFGVQSVPTLVILKDGEKITQFVGLQREETLISALEMLGKK